MIKPDTVPPFPSYIDSTMRGSLTACETKWYYAWLRRLTPIEKSPDLHAGGAFAEGLKVMREAFYAHGAPQEVALDLGIGALRTFYGDYQPPEKHPKTKEAMVEAMKSYVLQYPLATDVIQPYVGADDRPMIEFTFSLPIPGTSHPTTGMPINFEGRFDLIGRHNNGLYIVDEKTTKSLGGTWVNQWDMRGQFIGYAWAAQELGKLPVIGAFIRGVGILKTKITHAQAIVNVSPWQIDRFKEQLREDVNHAKDIWCYRAFNQSFDDACTAYGGCQFKKLCLSPNPENWVPNFYVRNNWNPLARDPESEPHAEPEPNPQLALPLGAAHATQR